jgi:hypothetical protein
MQRCIAGEVEGVNLGAVGKEEAAEIVEASGGGLVQGGSRAEQVGSVDEVQQRRIGRLGRLVCSRADGAREGEAVGAAFGLGLVDSLLLCSVSTLLANILAFCWRLTIDIFL